MNIAELSVKVVADVQKALSGLDQVSNKFETVGKGLQTSGRNMSKYVTAPLVGLATASIMAGMKFEEGMSKVQAISGATGDELKALTDLAKEMGATTKFSASQSSEALQYMAMAGWDTQSMLDGLSGVMLLAASSGEDLGTVSDIVTDALTAFGMEAKDSGRFADLLASTASNANTNVGMLGESFKYVAPIFGAMGFSAEDAALSLGLMANSGIKASMAGTSLRMAVNKLVSPTGEAVNMLKDLGIVTTNTDGTMKPFNEILGQLRTSFAGLSQEQQANVASTIFGQQAMSGMLAIINATEADYNKLSEATNNYDGTAQEMADTMMDNASGSFTIFKSALEGMFITISEHLLPIFTQVIEKITEWVGWFGTLDEGTQKTILKIAGFIAAIGPLLIILGTLFRSVGTIITTFGKLGGMFTSIGKIGGLLATGLKATIGFLFSPAGMIMVGILAVIAIGYALWKNWDTIKEKATQLWQWVTGAFKKLWEGIKNVFHSFLKGGVIGLVNDYILKPFFNIDLFRIGKDIIQGLLNGIKSMGSNLWSGVKSMGKKIADGFKDFFKIGSPSKLMKKQGMFVGQGVAVGLEDSSKQIAKASQSMNASIETELSVPHTSMHINNVETQNSFDYETMAKVFKDAITGLNVVMDNGALVGELATPIDKEFGRNSDRKQRGW